MAIKADDPRPEPVDPTQLTEEAFRELGELEAKYRQLLSSPRELLEWTRSDVKVAMRIARADVVPHLRTWFTPDTTAAWKESAGRSGAIGTEAAGVEWSYAAVHDKPYFFNGLRATGRPVVIRGYSVLGIHVPEDKQEHFRIWRYVDWAGLYGQLGLTMNWRVPLTPTHRPEPDDSDESDEPPVAPR